jgi:LacI family transcriptional regulator
MRGPLARWSQENIVQQAHEQLPFARTYHNISFYIMVDRPTIADLATAAGVSIATVDRVLNRRLPVKGDTVRRVVQAAEKIGFHAAGLLRQRAAELPARRFGFLLQKRNDYFYHAFGERLAAETRRSRMIDGRPTVEYVDDLSPELTAKRLKALAARADAVSIVAVEHPIVNDAVQTIAASGKPVFTLISDISAPQRTAYIAADSRKKGRIAAWTISRTARAAGKVGILVGTHGYLSQELVEMSFRSYFREYAPEFQLLEPVIVLDDEKLVYTAVAELITRHPDLCAIYSLGGGQDGLVRALQQLPRHPDMTVICNELMPSTRDGLIDGTITMALGTPIAAIAERTIDYMTFATDAASGVVVPQVLFSPELHLRETI